MVLFSGEKENKKGEIRVQYLAILPVDFCLICQLGSKCTLPVKVEIPWSSSMNSKEWSPCPCSVAK